MSSPAGDAADTGDASVPRDATLDAHDAGFLCKGTYGADKPTDGDYYITAFGCWLDANGVEHTDPGDNCIPSCLSKAIAARSCTWTTWTRRRRWGPFPRVEQFLGTLIEGRRAHSRLRAPMETAPTPTLPRERGRV
jgi:hypothetical protein